MTENEAIKEIQRLCCNESQYYQKGEMKCKDNCMYGDNFCSFQMAIKALKEVQAYRKLGTVEECREAVKKTKAKKIIKRSFVIPYEWIDACPVCKEPLGRRTKYCRNCGQRLESGE